MYPLDADFMLYLVSRVPCAYFYRMQDDWRPPLPFYFRLLEEYDIPQRAITSVENRYALFRVLRICTSLALNPCCIHSSDRGFSFTLIHLGNSALTWIYRYYLSWNTFKMSCLLSYIVSLTFCSAASYSLMKLTNSCRTVITRYVANSSRLARAVV